MNRYAITIYAVLATMIFISWQYQEKQMTKCEKAGGVYAKVYPSMFYSCVKTSQGKEQ